MYSEKYYFMHLTFDLTVFTWPLSSAGASFFSSNSIAVVFTIWRASKTLYSGNKWRIGDICLCICVDTHIISFYKFERLTFVLAR